MGGGAFGSDAGAKDLCLDMTRGLSDFFAVVFPQGFGWGTGLCLASASDAAGEAATQKGVRPSPLWMQVPTVPAARLRMRPASRRAPR